MCSVEPYLPLRFTIPLLTTLLWGCNAMFIKSILAPPPGPAAEKIQRLTEAGVPVPGILFLLAADPELSGPLNQLTDHIMRGPGELPPWQRETIAALTSSLNHCPF